MEKVRKNYLVETHYISPGIVHQTMTTKELRETLLATDGTVVAIGYAWEIKNKKLGPGVYKVWLSKEVY